MSPRKKEQNEQLREARHLQILESALTTYVMHGYNGTDVDVVAARAGLAKGLIYYYYKSKQELFRSMFEWALDNNMEISEIFFMSNIHRPPIERLVYYIRDIFVLVRKDPRIIQFAMRMPFDSHVVFGPDQWRKGLEKSLRHQKSLAQIIQQGIDNGDILKVRAEHAANCFWAVFVANLFNFSKMIGSSDNVQDKSPDEQDQKLIIREISSFCFQGLGLDYSKWGHCLEKIMNEKGSLI